MSKEGALSFHVVSGVINNEELDVGIHEPISIIRHLWQIHFERVGQSSVLKVTLSHAFTEVPDDCGIILNFEESGKVVVLQKIRDMPVDTLSGYTELREGKIYRVRARPIHSYNHPCREKRARQHRRT